MPVSCLPENKAFVSFDSSDSSMYCLKFWNLRIHEYYCYLVTSDVLLELLLNDLLTHLVFTDKF